MIFTPITKIENKLQEKEFLELINVYIRLVEVYCEKNKLVLSDAPLTDCAQELIDIGVIEKRDDISILRNKLKKDFDHFIECVAFAVAHKPGMNGLLNKLSNKERSIIQKSEYESKKPTLIDFFCGAGGLSLGFIQTGFSVRLANDIDEDCVNTYRYNHPELPSSKLIQGDIREIVNHVENYINDEIDIVVGGPPCQGFSSANQQRIIDDPRNELYKYFVKAVEKICPKFVLMENVKGMLKVANQVVEDYESLKIEKGGHTYSYKVQYRLLNSVNFSVAQSRERLIYIAIRDDVMAEKEITPELIFSQIEASCENNSIYVLADALRDIKPLDAPRIKNMNEVDSETCGKKIDVNYYAEHHNPYLILINNGRKIDYIFNHKARYVSDVNYEIYRKMDQGDDATNAKIADIMPYPDRNDVFKDKYYKLYADRPSRTITAHLRMDCHSHIHPFQIRALTPREAARVQSFPDDYLFLGPYLKTYMQIGNAVPCMMARGIAKIISAYL